MFTSAFEIGPLRTRLHQHFIHCFNYPRCIRYRCISPYRHMRSVTYYRFSNSNNELQLLIVTCMCYKFWELLEYYEYQLLLRFDLYRFNFWKQTCSKFYPMYTFCIFGVVWRCISINHCKWVCCCWQLAE